MAGNTGGTLDKYRGILRESHVEDQNALLGLHVLMYAVVNAIWVLLNVTLVPSKYRWLAFYPVVGWGLLVFVHWWFYVRNAERLCRLREERVINSMGMGSGESSNPMPGRGVI